jgi:hypothetical protein
MYAAVAAPVRFHLYLPQTPSVESLSDGPPAKVKKTEEPSAGILTSPWVPYFRRALLPHQLVR